ncbi:MAG: agmatinase [Caldilineaceae bacterium]
MTHHYPADSSKTPRFTGVRTFARLPHIQDLTDVDLAIIGVPFDTGVTYRVGARFGPEAVRSASAMLRAYNPDLKVKPFDVLSCVDYGDATVYPGYIHESYASIAATLQEVASHGVIPLDIGGDHSIALAELRGLAAVHGPLALVQFDSHGDLWDRYYERFEYTHGTPFRRALEEGLLAPERSVQLGMRGGLYGEEDLQIARDFGFTMLTTSELLTKTPAEIGALVRNTVGDAKAFLSFDIDFFDPAFAPGTGTPEVGGPTSFQGLQYLRACTGLNWIGGSVVEVLPAYDPSQITAQLGAQVAYEFMSLVALARAG